MDSKIWEIRNLFLAELKDCKQSKDIENLKIRYLGKKGDVSFLLEELKKAPSEKKPLLGKIINDLKEEISLHCENSFKRFLEEEQETQLSREWIDVTLPGKRQNQGRDHPVTKMLQRCVDILVGMGFSVQCAPNLESDYYNFEALNFSKDHPAREMQDTFYVTPDLLLRTQTTNAQVRMMKQYKPPLRMISFGKCFRNENISARSHVFFHQIDAFYIDREVHFGDLLATLREFYQRVFQKEVEMRFRPSYFPFVEPGVEVDIRCTVCSGEGCRVCKQSGWLEVAGAGMIHPEVLKEGGIDPEIYKGYAWGGGIERLLMLQRQIPDIRLFTENDQRFLEQFI